MADREMYWDGRQPDAGMRRAMAAELSALCEAMGWDYDLVDEAGTSGGRPEVGRRQGVVIYPHGIKSREDGEEASFAFFVGEEIQPYARDTIMSSPRGEKPVPGDGPIIFKGGGFWWLADRGLLAICAFIKRLWVPNLTWLGCGGTRLSPVIESYLLGSEEEVLEAFRSATFREFLAQCQIEPAGQRLRFRDDLRHNAEAWFQQRHLEFPALEAALDQKFPGYPWRDLQLTVLPFNEEIDRKTLLGAGYSTLGDLVREGRKGVPLWEHFERMEFENYQRLKRSFIQASESLQYLGEATTPISAEDLAPHIPPPPEPHHKHEVARPTCIVLDASDPELIAVKKDLVHLLQADPPDTLRDLYTRLGRMTLRTQVRVVIWPHLMVVEFREGRVGLIPFGDLLASLARFQDCFEVEVGAFVPETADYLNTVEPDCPNREEWQSASVERVPESERGQVIQTILQTLLKTMAHPYFPTPNRRLEFSWEVSEWLQGRNDGVFSKPEVDLPWRFWRGFLVNRPRGCFRLVDWTLVRELVAFCSNHLSAAVPNLLVLSEDFHNEELQQALGLPNRLTASEVLQRAAELPTWRDRLSEVGPGKHKKRMGLELRQAMGAIENFLMRAKNPFEPGLSLRGLKHHLLGEPGWTPWWPLAQALWSRHNGTCAKCTHLWRTTEGEAVCRLTTRLLSNPEETFCLAHSDSHRDTPSPASLPPLFRMQPGGSVGFSETEPGEVTSPDTWEEMPSPPSLRLRPISLDDKEDL